MFHGVVCIEFQKEREKVVLNSPRTQGRSDFDGIHRVDGDRRL